jgi:endonuclease YncB( thermonuclease family)
MFRTVVVLVLLLASTPAASTQRGKSVTGRRDLVGRQFDARVARVADGDTIEAIPSGEQRPVRMRLEGIDAPELSEAFGRESLTRLRVLLLDQLVRVNGRDMDRYGRLVARVSVQGKDASTVMIQAGLACHAFARDPALAQEERQAQRGGLGFWASNAQKPRCVTR